jgi:ABC-type Zn uptake system ZnuABC Zn-binding protein ZnuA
MILITVLALAVAAVGCGSDDSGGGSGRPSVVATTGILADITENVAGRDAEVTQLIPDSSSPHDFQLSAEDRQRLDDAALVTANGADLEHGVPLDDADTPVWELTAHAGKLRPAGEEEQGAEEPAGEEEPEGAFDPHVWMDPTRVAAALPSLADVLADADPAHADGYRQRARSFARELREVDTEIKHSVDAIPKGDRRLVTSHAALGYFAARYGFEIVTTPFPASGPEAEPSAARLRDVEEAIRDAGVPTVFAEETDDPKVLRRVAEDTGVSVNEMLLVEAPGSAGTYAEMLREDARLLRQGLGG